MNKEEELNKVIAEVEDILSGMLAELGVCKEACYAIFIILKHPYLKYLLMMWIADEVKAGRMPKQQEIVDKAKDLSGNYPEVEE